MAISINKGFLGIVAKDVDGNPPNVMIAAGPNNLINATIWRIALMDKTGNVISSMASRDFFNETGDDKDPTVIYNPFQNNYLVAGIVPNGLVAMVSNNSTPHDLLPVNWKKISFGLVGSDFDRWGYNADGYAVVFSIPQAILLRVYNDLTYNTVTMPFPDMQFGSSPVVAKMPDSKSGDPMWFIRVKDSDKNALSVYKLASLKGTPVGTEYTVPTLQGYLFNNGRQPSGGSFFTGPPNGGECFVRNVDGKTILTYVAITGNSQLSCTVYCCTMDITSGVPIMIQQDIIDGGASLDFFNASVVVDTSGNVILNMLKSGPTTYITNILGYKKYNDPNPFTLVTLQSSTVGMLGARTGDYSCVCIDPSDGSFWSVNEIANTPTASPTFNWASWVQNSSIPTSTQTIPFTGTLNITIDGVVKQMTVQGTGII